MLFKRRGFLSVGVACVSLMALNRAAFAMGVCKNDHKIDPGDYCATVANWGAMVGGTSTEFREQQQCPAGCYCEGWTPTATLHETPSVFPNAGWDTDRFNEQLIKWCKSGTKCSKSAGYNQCGNSNAAKVWKCPSEFPNSAKGSKKSGDCYAVLGSGEKLYYKQVKCEAGKYLPTGWSHCASCKSSDSRYYCPGGYFIPSTSKSVGLKECPSGQIANVQKSGCMSSKIKCNPGQYLPAGAKTCSSCKAGRYYACEGGTFTFSAKSAQGIMECKGGRANIELTQCESGGPQQKKTTSSGSISVPAGKYLPAEKTTPVTCKGATKYCPGGNYDSGSSDQGIFNCPGSSRANASKTACTITLSKVRMQYGANGTSTPYPRQCWYLTDEPEKYATCILAPSVTGK